MLLKIFLLIPTSDSEIVLEVLQCDMKNLLNWFKINSMKPNPKKIQFMILGPRMARPEDRLPVIPNINNIKIRESQEVILLGLTIDNCLTFKGHIDTLCHNASYKLHALRRIIKYLTPDKAKPLYNTFINSQFSYASIIWMFCRTTDYLKMGKTQYKALKVVFNSNESFEDLILHSNKVSIHQKQLRQLTTEVYKSLTDVSPEFINPFFTVREIPYNVCNGHIVNLPSVRPTYYGTSSIFFRACQVWNKLPISIKQSQSLLEFKTKTKALRNIECLCNICKSS